MSCSILFILLFFSSVHSFSAVRICSKAIGLTGRQRSICSSRPDAMIAIIEGEELAKEECRYQFRNHRWNCARFPPGVELFPKNYTDNKTHRNFSKSHRATREVAAVYGMRSSAVAFSIAKHCSQGHIPNCSCDRKRRADDWSWSGCSPNLRYSLGLTKIFVDSKERPGSNREKVMNIHNNAVGRKIMRKSMETKCKCHGTSGSCAKKTCWKSLPTFRQVGKKVYKHYKKARPVSTSNGRMRLRRSEIQRNKVLRKHLIYLSKSPSYCEADEREGFEGTRRRRCSLKGPASCRRLCCERGFTLQVFNQTEKCHCKFQWCCKLVCQTCYNTVKERLCN
ncbi:DgyrCDS3549 [Dimorphilus gyrociliatus]|uniref:Protein Wnt n=1 Tax=Dimorphilus gyrociliatus TaxID=2664684 RepID=A0A7I8VFG7_9ANNE|nr:DgyrCDS3549 [Dimorphilus gyrociliatus]